jgi:hypothetical protein
MRINIMNLVLFVFLLFKNVEIKISGLFLIYHLIAVENQFESNDNDRYNIIVVLFIYLSRTEFSNSLGSF